MTTTTFSVQLASGYAQVQVFNDSDLRLGQTIEDTLAEMGRVPLSRIINLAGADYKVKYRRRGVRK